jgi:hypothetical protein
LVRLRELFDVLESASDEKKSEYQGDQDAAGGEDSMA